MIQQLGHFVLGSPVKDDLPERIQNDISKQQNSAELLISCVHLFLVSFLFLLWFTSPPPLAEIVFEPIPWILSVYGSFTIIRLIVSLKTELPTWFLNLSVVMDIVLLMTLIWSFHIQYLQPPSFYLKAPTVFYAFVFIAVRALRFEPRYILMTGATAMLGWLILVGYVLYSDPLDSMITRNFVDYMTSNSVLIGAEIDKIVAIAMVTALLAIATERARRSFIRSIFESTTAADLSRFVSREIATKIVTADEALEPGDGEKKLATVLFTDIEGFSSLSETISPEELALTLNDYFDALNQVVEDHGGVITQFQGDAMLVVFNALSSRDDPDHAAHAIKCAEKIISVCEDRRFGNNHSLKTRCGINTGSVIFGIIGAKDRLVFTVHGDSVNLAARLEQLNKEYGTYILFSDATRIASGRSENARRMGVVTVRGRSAPTDIYSLQKPL